MIAAVENPPSDSEPKLVQHGDDIMDGGREAWATVIGGYDLLAAAADVYCKIQRQFILLLIF